MNFFLALAIAENVIGVVFGLMLIYCIIDANRPQPTPPEPEYESIEAFLARTAFQEVAS